MKRIFSLAFLTLGFLLMFPGNGSAKTCTPGDKAQVMWRGTWYPATVLNAKGNKCYIQYDGYGSNWNEWVGPGRIQVTSSLATGTLVPNSVLLGNPGYRVGSPVQVLWQGKWYPAHVKQMRGNQLFIHYDGYGNNWDEWVGPNRYR